MAKESCLVIEERPLLLKESRVQVTEMTGGLTEFQARAAERMRSIKELIFLIKESGLGLTELQV